MIPTTMGGSSNHGDPLLTAMEAGVPHAGSPSPSSSPMKNFIDKFSHIWTDCGKRTWKQKINIIIYSVSVAAILFAMLAIVLESYSAVCFVAFCIPFVTSPYVIHQRRKLNKLPKFREVINLLRNQANRLMKQNNRFAASNTRLESELVRLKQIEFQLHQKCQASGSSVKEMRALIDENGTYQREMKKLQDAHEVQNLLTAILLSDSNLDFSMTEPEMDRLMLRLQCASVVDEEKLRELLGGMMSPSSSPLKKIREIEACIAADDVFFDE